MVGDGRGDALDEDVQDAEAHYLLGMIDDASGMHPDDATIQGCLGRNQIELGERSNVLGRIPMSVRSLAFTARGEVIAIIIGAPASPTSAARSRSSWAAYDGSRAACSSANACSSPARRRSTSAGAHRPSPSRTKVVRSSRLSNRATGRYQI